MNDPIDKSFLATIDTKTLLLGFTVTLIVALFISYKYRNTYKASKMLKAYGFFSLAFCIIFLFLKIKIVLIIGILLMGLVALALRSNHYFYQ